MFDNEKERSAKYTFSGYLMRPRLHRLRQEPSGGDEPPRLGIQAIAATVQSFALASAVLVGGVWTYHTYKAQRLTDTAQINLQNAQAQLLKAQRELETEPRLEIDIGTELLSASASQSSEVLGTVNIKNVGSANTLLQWDTAPVRIYQVTVGEKGELWSLIRSVELMSSDKEKTSGLLCQVNATKHAHFVATVGDPGLYVVTFTAVRSAAEAASAKSLGARGRLIWQEQHYFTVK